MMFNKEKISYYASTALYLVSNKISGLLLSLYVANVYGPEVLAPFAFALTTSMFMYNLSAYPLNITAMKLYSKHDFQSSYNIYYTQIILITFIALISYVVSLIYYQPAVGTILIYFVFSIDFSIDNILQKERLSNEIRKLSFYRFFFFLVIIGYTYLIKEFSVSIYTAILSIYITFKLIYVHKKIFGDPISKLGFKIWSCWDIKSTMGPVLTSRGIIAISQLVLFNVVYNRVPIVEAAALGIGFQLKGIVDFFSATVSKASLPYFLDRKENENKIFKSNQFFVIIFGLILIVFFYAFLDLILRLYGSEDLLYFEESILLILIGSCVSLMSSVYSNLILSKNKEVLLVVQNASWLFVYLAAFFYLGSYDLRAISIAWLISYIYYYMFNYVLGKFLQNEK
ncbi:lipopolysaccharide biosynthesis protein [Vibrio cyclitrophicus 1F53]|uniref:lipopolysaccharide biosynthesis protein n=1 Tax=Vibrio cyclitrophicus TaxID=47951 RepID=UPI0002E8D164|nr:hypothetical protein [Vibrio cyclitrophicus]OEF32105.1 hypothetical protein OA7_16345 [Vibrio cyclitrophicus 1F53]PMH33107.1 hypothetical protein BCU72_15000 [Vibrio cyclitrophicus]